MLTDLLYQLHHLFGQLQQLQEALQNAPTRAVLVLEADDPERERVRAIDSYLELFYREGQDGRETLSRPGLLSCPPELLAQVVEINQHKTLCREAVRQFREQGAHARQTLDQALQELTPSWRQALRSSGLSRLHLKQAFRQIPWVDRAPDKVGFSWYGHGRSIKRLTLKQAEQLLIALGSDKPHIQVQLARLGRLPPATPLAQIQTQAPVVRANLLWRANTEHSEQRRAMNLPLPLLFPCGKGFPDYKRLPAEPPAGRQRQSRRDLRIDPEPYLPSIRVHRYQEASSH